MDRKVFYAAQAAKLNELRQQFFQGFCHIARDGRTTEVNLENASRCIVEGTHELATPDQIAAFKAAQEMAASQSRPVDSLDSARRMWAAISEAKGKAR